MKKIIAIIIFLSIIAISSTFAQNVVMIDGTKNAGKVEWVRNIDVATIPYGVPKPVEFLVKNTTNEPLILIDVKSSCGCTVAEFSKEPVLPGGSTKIKATYNAKTEGEFYKIITVITNFDKENSVTLSIQGVVKK